MRNILSNSATGTPAYNNSNVNAAGEPTAPINNNVGVMPNLGLIIPRLASQDTGVADIYLRDNINDDGNVPSTGMISASPDIIVRHSEVPNPQSSFGFSTIKLDNT